MMNELARDLSYAKEKVQYDTQCKQVLSQKEILAWILQRTVKEFTNMAVSDIIPCIEGTPEVSSVPVNPGETNAEKISGMPNEDKVPDEGSIYYDIRFYVYAPVDREKIRMIINVEAQNSFYPGYDIVTRGIFYVSRMISAQLGTEFSDSEYDNIKKVYSIWVCMHSPQKIGNAISHYHMEKEDLLSGLPDIPKSYDKLSVIIIALNERVSSDDKFINMMNTLLSTQKTYQEKRSALENTYHISMSYNLGKELGKMDHVLDDVIEQKLAEGLSQGLERGLQEGQAKGLAQGLAEGRAEGLSKGRAEGLAEGLAEGQNKAKKELITNLLRLKSLSDQEILKVACISPEELQAIKDEMTALV